MIAFHALYDPPSQKLHVWAESSPSRSSVRAVPGRGKDRAEPHPFMLGRAPLVEYASRIIDKEQIKPSSLGELCLVLPSTSKAPVPSPWLGERQPKDEWMFRAWQVITLSFSPRGASDWMFELPDPFPEGMTAGDSFLFWKKVTQWGWNLLYHGQFVPSADPGLPWKLKNSAAVSEQLEEARAFMPPLCSAVRYAQTTQRLFPQMLIQDFLDKWISQEVQLIVGKPPSFEEIPTEFFSPLGLRLEPPADNGGRWKIRFHLMCRQDPSLFVPAEKIWNRPTRDFPFLQFENRNAQEELLSQLAQAAQSYPLLQRSLEFAHPCFVELDTQEAYVFLTEQSLRLQAQGFKVLVPRWWRRPAAKLGIQLTAGSEGKDFLGLDTLLDFSWEAALGNEKISREDFEKLRELKLPLVNLKGQWIEIEPGMLEEIQILLENSGKKETLPFGRALKLYLENGSFHGIDVNGLRVDGPSGKSFEALLDSEKLFSSPVPSGLRGELRPYQARGYSWLVLLKSMGWGACLADDMGLGKTIQMITLLLHEKEISKKSSPSLLVCPMSIVGNWQREIERFAPSLRVWVHHGSGRTVSEDLQKEVQGYDLVITTYTLAYRDQKILETLEWHYLILDEAQNIKNASAKQSLAVRSFRAAHKAALTGTPVENRLSELWSLMDFLNPGYLGPLASFRLRYVLPIEKDRNKESTETLKKIIKPFFLRRLKMDKTIIQDLPEKMEMKVYCNLTQEQAALYQAAVDQLLSGIETFKGIQRKGLILKTLLELKQICNHPSQYLKEDDANASRSGKLSRIKEMLEEALSEGDQCLVFTQFSGMGQLLKRHLEEVLDRKISFLHGKTSLDERERMIQDFQNSGQKSPVLILSLKAGGLGLNLTAANRVFHFDRWWNPAVEDQATDRAFRIGQGKKVQVHKFVCVGTVEESIDRMLEDKKGLSEMIMGETEDWVTELSTEELKRILPLKQEAIGE